MYQKNKQEINTNVISKIWASEQTLQKMDSEKAIYGKLYYHFNNFCSLASSVRVPKAATFKRFSVRPCWSPILLKLQNSIAGVFQCIFNKISEHVFYKTKMKCYFGTKKGRCKYWSSVVLFESGITSEKTKVQIF